MQDTRAINLNVRLPRAIAEQAEAVHEEDPEFLSRVVLYGLTRRSVYEQLRSADERSPAIPSAPGRVM